MGGIAGKRYGTCGAVDRRGVASHSMDGDRPGYAPKRRQGEGETGDEVAEGHDNDAEMDRRATPDGKRCKLVKAALGHAVGRTKCQSVGLTP